MIKRIIGCESKWRAGIRWAVFLTLSFTLTSSLCKPACATPAYEESTVFAASCGTNRGGGGTSTWTGGGTYTSNPVEIKRAYSLAIHATAPHAHARMGCYGRNCYHTVDLDAPMTLTMYGVQTPTNVGGAQIAVLGADYFFSDEVKQKYPYVYFVWNVVNVSGEARCNCGDHECRDYESFSTGQPGGVSVVLYSLKGPVITADMQNTSGQTDQGATFSIKADNATKYQWQKSTGTSFTDISDGEGSNKITYSGCNTDTLTISNLRLAENGTVYRCVVSDDDGQSVISNEAMLAVSDTSPPILNVEKLTKNWTNDKVIFSVDAYDADSALAAEPYSFDGGKHFGGSKVCELTENGSYVFCVADAAGNIGQFPVNLTTIDRTLPNMNVSVSTTDPTTEPVKITITASDSDSGISQDAYWYKENWNASNVFSVNTNGDYTVGVRDQAGNVVRETVHVMNIYSKAKDPVHDGGSGTSGTGGNGGGGSGTSGAGGNGMGGNKSTGGGSTGGGSTSGSQGGGSGTNGAGGSGIIPVTVLEPAKSAIQASKLKSSNNSGSSDADDKANVKNKNENKKNNVGSLKTVSSKAYPVHQTSTTLKNGENDFPDEPVIDENAQTEYLSENEQMPEEIISRSKRDQPFYLALSIGLIVLGLLLTAYLLFFMVVVEGKLEDSDEEYGVLSLRLLYRKGGFWSVNVGDAFEENATVRLLMGPVFALICKDADLRAYTTDCEGVLFEKVQQGLIMYRRRIRRGQSV